MAETTKDTYDFIKSALPIHIGILSSEDAESACQKNNLSFCELIRPFCTLTNETQIHGIGSQSYRVYNLHVHASDIRQKHLTVSDSTNREILNDLISKSVANENPQMVTISCGEESLYVNRSCPWMDIYRNNIFRSGPQQDHEFLSHLVACMLVVSSQHPDPVREFANLSQAQNRIQHSDNNDRKPKWMTPNTLKYYVLLHDVENGDEAKAKEVLSSLQSMYGGNASYLLKLNSRTTSASEIQDIPVPWKKFKNLSTETANATKNSIPNQSFGCCLTMTDHNSLQRFLQDFITLALLPFIERTIKSINDQLSARKALHKSLFRATRTFFGSSKSSTPALSGTGYHHDANELLVRKVADLCFLSQMYDQAFQQYHSAKKDYMNDQTWLHAAGASEMAAVSNFMQRNAQKTFPAHYMENAINSYTDVCKNDYLALRCTLLHVECLQSLGFYLDAAFYFVKLTNETDDLRSALLLEQAAHCYLKMRKKNPRKFAFQLILSGHRFSKCAQSVHALRCYEMALQIYQSKGWLMVEDHLNLAIARQSCNTKHTSRAVDFFRQLLTRESSRADSQQLATLREFFNVWQQASNGPDKSSEYAKLDLPKLVVQETKLFFGHAMQTIDKGRDVHELNSKLTYLEEIILDSEGLMRGNLVGAVTCLTKSTRNNQIPQLATGESALIEITMKNHLSVSIGLSNIEIEWDFTPADEKNTENFVVCEPVEFIFVPAAKDVTVQFSVKPLRPGKLTAACMTYNLFQTSEFDKSFRGENDGPFVGDRQILQISGRRLNKTKKEKLGLMYDVDYRFSLKALPSLAQISAKLEGFPVEMMCNEVLNAELVMENIGNVQIDALKIASSDRVQFVLEYAGGSNYILPNVPPSNTENPANVASLPSLLQEPLMPGSSVKFRVTLKAPSSAGTYQADILLFCKSESLPNPCYRSYFMEQSVKCNDSIDVNIDMVTPLTQNNFVLAVSTKNAAVDNAGEFSLKDVSCVLKNGDVKPISNQKSAALELGTNMYTYFNLSNTTDSSDADATNSDQFRVKLDWNCESGAEKKLFHGQHDVSIGHLFNNLGTFSSLEHGDLVKSRSNSDFSLQTLHHAVSWRLHYQESNKHDFTTDKICVLSLNLLIFNLSNWHLVINVTLPKCGERSNTSHQPGFSWLGTTKLKRLIEPHGEIKLPLKAGFTRPGVFSLSGVGVAALPKRSDDTQIPIPQKPMCGYHISIFNA